jgi:type II secretory pathway pseudopilin PulG
MTPAIRDRDQRGFALPAVIFLVALLTLLLTSGLSRVQADRQIAEASEATADAFALAQSGLYNYIGSLSARPPDGDSVRINLTGGYANVISRVLRNPSDTTENSLYLVRSTGIVINPLAGSVTQAQRTVAQFADWQPGSIERRAALTTPNGAWHRDDPDGNPWWIEGTDACGVEPPIPALRTTNITEPSPTTTPIVYTGSVVQEGAGTGPAIAAQTEIDWATVTSPAFVPDFTTFQDGDLAGFSIQRLSGNYIVSSGRAGSGILIIPGRLDLDPGGAFYFRGVVLVGDYVDFDAGTAVIEGLLVSGLNMQQGFTPPRTELGAEADFIWIRFHSCYVNQAMAALTGMAPVANAWLDSWAKY